MLTTMQVTTLLLVALAMACAVGHALELPGKMRLPEDVYFAVQPIYYPGYTIAGGIGEFGGMLATVALLLVTPRGTDAFWLTASAFVAMLFMQAIFWLFTQPANKVWTRDQNMGRAGSTFFRVGRGTDSASDWTAVRDQWEYSHVARAVLAVTAVGLLAVAIAVS